MVSDGRNAYSRTFFECPQDVISKPDRLRPKNCIGYVWLSNPLSPIYPTLILPNVLHRFFYFELKHILDYINSRELPTFTYYGQRGSEVTEAKINSHCSMQLSLFVPTFNLRNGPFHTAQQVNERFLGL